MKNQTKKDMALLTILILGLIGSLSFLVVTILDSENITINDYSFTKAICTDENYCEDNLVVCKNNALVSITPIGGASAKFPKDWEDPRSEEQINKLCS